MSMREATIGVRATAEHGPELAPGVCLHCVPSCSRSAETGWRPSASRIVMPLYLAGFECWRMPSRAFGVDNIRDRY